VAHSPQAKTGTFVLAVSCCLALSAVKAADLPPQWDSDLSGQSVYRWRGLYGGVHVGGMSATDAFAPIGFPDSGWIGIPPSTVTNPRGWVAGGQYGYSDQIGAIVFGFEQDLMLGAP
jgi:hypothetical protein